jgi:hypothetical protein
MELEDITEGMTVRLRGPDYHPLHGITGTVLRVLLPDELWRSQPGTLLADPFSWLDGQLLVSLDDRPDDPAGHRWAPVVTVRPGDAEDPAAPPADGPEVPPARVKLREILAAARTPVTRPMMRSRLHEEGFEVRRETVARWLAEDQARYGPETR